MIVGEETGIWRDVIEKNLDSFIYFFNIWGWLTLSSH